ncbi:MAG TPA: MarR family transcriptional regulator [Myxococcota bacterium]|nr:MarR family transcriptional regulator [Myxococcota bacterium]
MERTVGVTGPQRFVIRIVGRFPGIPAGELARLLHIHPSTLSGILARLERSGLLRRRADPRDARRSLLGLTEKGRRLDVASAGTVESAMESTLRGAHPRTLQAAREVLQSFADSLAASGEADEAPAIAEPSPRARRSRRIASPREQRRARRRW